MSLFIYILFLYSEYLYFIFAQELWPNGKIPFIIDHSLKNDAPQLYALLTAKSELEKLSCIKFHPRKYENDYVHFINNGDQTLCWNIFDKVSGPNPVNVGPECLEPFKNDNNNNYYFFNDDEIDVDQQQPQEIISQPFGDCDIAYLNELYQCDISQYPITVNEKDCPQGRKFGRKLRPMKGMGFSPKTLKPKNTPKWPPPKLPPTWANRITSTKPRPRPRPRITRPTIAPRIIPTTKSIQPQIGGVVTIPGTCNSACMYFGNLTPFYRSVNEDVTVANHFYTENRLEQSQMTARGYMTLSNLGFIGQTPIDPACGCLRPLYRLYNDFYKDTLLTAEEEEKTRATMFLGYRFERTIGYCTSEPGCGAYLPLYRLYNAFVHDHMYVTQQSEMYYYKTHPGLGYGVERVECYVWEFSSSAKACEN